MKSDRSPVDKSLEQRLSLIPADEVSLELGTNWQQDIVADITPEQLQDSEDIAGAIAAATSYLAARASTSNGFADVWKWIHPDNYSLIDFERDRFNNLGVLGKPTAWNGVIERTWSDPTILDCYADDDDVQLAIRDWTGVQWRPAPVTVHRTPDQEALVRKFPEKYGLNIPDFSLTTSGFGTRHDITMVHTSRGWRVERDGYLESITALGGASPDHVEARNASGARATSSSKQVSTPAPSTPARNLLRRTFDWASAANYGFIYAYHRNTAYTDFWPDDCANFVSQCFRAGGYPMDNTWARYTNAWIDNVGLRNWLITSGKGVSTDEGALGLGDIINYDWQPDGIYDHVAIVTGLPGPLISCHSADRQNVPYKSIGQPATTFLFTSTLVSY